MKAFVAKLLALGPAGLFVIAILDGAGVPIPSAVDILLITIASNSPSVAYIAALGATLGSILGCLVLFYLARKGGEMYLERHTLSRGGQRFRQWFQHYGLLTVFIAALVPLPVMPMKIFVACSGALGSRPLAFTLSLAGARIPRYLALAYLGTQMGTGALTYLRSHVLELCAVAVALFLVLFGLVKISDRMRLKRVTGSPSR